MKTHQWLMAIAVGVAGAVAFFWTQGVPRVAVRETAQSDVAKAIPTEDAPAITATPAQPRTVAPPASSPPPSRGAEPIAASAADKAPRTQAPRAAANESHLADMNAAIAALFEEMVTDDHKHAFQSPAIAAHAAVQNEQIDPQWAPIANQQIESYFEAEFGDRYEMPMIDCRTDICEIRAVGKPSGNMDADTLDWQRAAGRMQAQPWWSTVGFDEQNVLVTSVPGGPPMFILFITRK